MQSVSSRIWTRVAVSISYDDNDYTTGLSTQEIWSAWFEWFRTEFETIKKTSERVASRLNEKCWFEKVKKLL